MTRGRRRKDGSEATAGTPDAIAADAVDATSGDRASGVTAAPPRDLDPGLERGLWIALILVAAFVRLIYLDVRPFHHDESLHAWFSYEFATKGDYKYDPVYHGPIQYFAVASTYRLIGDSDFTARLPAALGGVFLVFLMRMLKPRFGARAALVSGALVALAPNFLYFTRFCREDIWSLLGTAGTFLYLDAWTRSRRVKDLAFTAIYAAVAFASKENFYVLLALMGPSLVAAWWEPGVGIRLFGRLRELIDFLEENWIALAGALALFFSVSEICYTVFLVHPESGNPAFDAISYWWGQHKSQRVGGPPTFYLPRLLQYEFAIVLPAVVFILLRWKRFDAAHRFVATLGLSSIGMYAYLGEKTPWLLLHQLLPLVPMAAAAWVAAATVRTGRAVAGVTAAATILTSFTLSFALPAIHGGDLKAESVVYVQTTPEILEVIPEIERAEAAGARPAAAVVGEANWPFSWYLRHRQIAWSLPTADLKPPIAIVDTEKADEVATTLGPGWEKKEVPLRAWWVPEVSTKPLHPNPKEILEYLFTRKVWAPVGSQNVAVFRYVGENPPRQP